MRTRCELFNKAYNHISERIDQVYKDLTKGKAAPMGGVAYLSLEDSEVWPKLITLEETLTPYGTGTIQCRYQVSCHAPYEAIQRHGTAIWRRKDDCGTGPTVRHPQVSWSAGFLGSCIEVSFSYQPSPFFVLDEVDAALDNTNVAKIANYIRSHASDSFQFIVISLKGSLYERSNSLVGIYRDQEVNSSRTLTLDVSYLAPYTVSRADLRPPSWLNMTSEAPWMIPSHIRFPTLTAV